MSSVVRLVSLSAANEEGRRIIRGWASTGQKDRLGDIVEPSGVKYKLPLPLLIAHDHGKPIGKVTGAEVSDQGIRIIAEVAAGIAEADRAWQLIKADLMQHLSIGFRPLKSERINAGGGLRITEWEWLELSLVTIPANPEARIETAVGKSGPGKPRSAHKRKPVKLIFSR